jgi:DNA polymerase-3 subunit gamma/tau
VNQALYRRYRPETFAEVIGQEHVTEPLAQALRTGRVSHAYLFSGPRGCGKTTCARILARCLNCAQGPTAQPCGECPSCRELGRGGGGSLDVEEIDAASHGGVDDTRDLREKAAYAPARDRYKIFILDEAHMVSREGFNALLKIVEEPPPHVKFVFATTEPNKVLATIRSRSHHYPFRLVPPGLLTAYMEDLAAREGIAVDPGVMPLVVRSGGGSVRDTESVLDQLIGGSHEGRITYQSTAALLGFTPDALIGGVVAALRNGDGAAMFQVVESVVESGLEPARFAEDLLERLRDLIVLAAAGPGAGPALGGLPREQVEDLAAQAAEFGLSRLSAAADAVSAGLAAMAGATSPRLQLELLAARALLTGPGAPPSRGAGAGAGSAAGSATGAGGGGRPPAGAGAAPGGTASGPAPAGRAARAGGDGRPAGSATGAGAPAGGGAAAALGGTAPGRAPASRAADDARSRPAQAAGPGADQGPGRAFVDWDEPEAPPQRATPPPRAGQPDQGRPAAPRPQPQPGDGRAAAEERRPGRSGPALASGPGRDGPGLEGGAGGDGPAPRGGPGREGPALASGPGRDGPGLEGDAGRTAATAGPAGAAAGAGDGQVPGDPAAGAAPAGAGVGGDGLDAVARWEEILQVTRQFSVTAFAMLNREAQLAGASNDTLTLTFRSADLAQAFTRRFQGALEEAASRVLGRPVKAHVTASDQPPPARPAAAPAPAPGSRPAATPGAARQAEANRQPAPAPGPAIPVAARPAPTASPAGRPPGQAGPGPASGSRVAPPTSAPAPDMIEDDDIPSPDDPDAGLRGLTGVPLIVEMLDGQILEEFEET